MEGKRRRSYGVATISRLLKIIGLFCKRALYKRLYFAEETYNFKEPTNCSHPIVERRGETGMGWLRLVDSLSYRSLLQNILSFTGLFAKETYTFKEPTNCSHPIRGHGSWRTRGIGHNKNGVSCWEWAGLIVYDNNLW